MVEALGRVMSVAGSQITVSVDAERLGMSATRVGAMVKVPTADREVVGTISAITADGTTLFRPVRAVDLLGGIVASPEGQSQFNRGVSVYPVSGAPVLAATEADLTALYAPPSSANIRIGTL